MTSRSEWLTPDFLGQVLQLRLVVARLGEAEMYGWWGTQDVLGETGELVFRRGFPRTHSWARAQAVFAVARQRCAEQHPDPSAITLWQLPAEIEAAFDQQWNRWLEDVATWQPWFARPSAWQTPDLAAALHAFELTTPAAAQQAQQWVARGPAVPLPVHSLQSDTLAMLAQGFAKGARGQLVVPYFHLAEA